MKNMNYLLFLAIFATSRIFAVQVSDLNLNANQVRAIKNGKHVVEIYCQTVTPPKGIAIGQVRNPDYNKNSKSSGGQTEKCTIYLVPQKRSSRLRAMK